MSTPRLPRQDTRTREEREGDMELFQRGAFWGAFPVLGILGLFTYLVRADGFSLFCMSILLLIYLLATCTAYLRGYYPAHMRPIRRFYTLDKAHCVLMRSGFAFFTTFRAGAQIAAWVWEVVGRKYGPKKAAKE